MFGRISHTWSLMGASWEILKQDKEMLIFPLISGICCLMVLASFAVPLVLTDSWTPPAKNAPVGDQVAYYAMLFAFYFCNYLVIVFFNSAVIACATIRLSGGDPTLGDGFRAAMSRLPLIIGWALVSATVGLILRLIEDRSEKVGALVAGLLGMAWSVVSFLAIPILVIEREGPLTALKRSTALLKKTWGQQLVGNFSFGMVFFLLSIPAYLVIGLGVFLGMSSGLWPVTIVCVVLSVIYLIVLALIESVLFAIFQAALYLYARDGEVPTGFQADLLIDSMGPK
ncbi:MAG: hypothetical protein JW818_17755 [Pirellulales bacterium]|nr:hypothetical protein [Pirellulales bacterium]